MTDKYVHCINGVEVPFTEAEITARKAEEKAWLDGYVERKLSQIRELRNQKLSETDWWVMRGNMTEEQSTYRQNLRDIPQDYSEDKYDELLATDEQDNLTHTVWSKP